MSEGWKARSTEEKNAYGVVTFHDGTLSFQSEFPTLSLSRSLALFSNVLALPPQELRGEGAPLGRRSPRAATTDPAAAFWRRRAQGAPGLCGNGEAVSRKEGTSQG